ncbi:MAG TPA: asparagine synthetase B, partial [Algoriphagus sp.]|nr:asparagine synthetase B [Algoriphagus sp.]
AGYDYYLKNSQNLIQGVKSSPLRPEVLDANFSSLASQNQFPKPFEEELLNLQYRDLFYTKIPRALRFNDRVSMAFSTELREPFLDYRLIEYVFSRPKDFKIKDGKQKWLLRKIANKYLGEEISLAPKRPLQTPQREWLSDNLKDWVYDEISSLRQNAWFDYAKIEKELSKFMKGDNDSSFHVWQWLNTALLLHDK